MGSYCSIHFDELAICFSKSVVPDDWAALFQERDRREEVRHHPDAQENDKPQRFVEYVTGRDVMLRRLAILGATDVAKRRAFDQWLSDERARWREYSREWSKDDSPDKYATQVFDGLNDLDYEGWCRLSAKALRNRYDFLRSERIERELDPFQEQFYETDDSYIWFSEDGSHIGLRALLDATPDTVEVRLDISDLIDNGYIPEDEQICANARVNAPHQVQSLAPTMIMAEGSSDLTALRLGLESLHPEMTEYFSFFNHAELSVDGGAAYLVKFLKAIAAARSTSRILAIFDNDTTGTQACDHAKTLGLPENIMVTRYPVSDIARSYPTIGPSGPAVLDVNGRAAGIELYLGRKALTYNGDLCPVRWTGFNASAGEYQGEVVRKGEVLDAFRKNIAAAESAEAARASFPDLERVWQHIFDLVEYNAGGVYLRMLERLRQKA